MTSVAHSAVAAALPTGEPQDAVAERLIDAMTTTMQTYARHLGVELGQHQALAVVAAVAPLLVGGGRPESSALLLAGVTNARSVIPRPSVPTIDDAHNQPVAEVGAAEMTSRGRTVTPNQLLTLAREELQQLAEGRPPAEPAGGTAELRRIGDLWRITFAGVAVHLPHSKGIGDLAALLARPGREIAAFDLAAGAEPGSSGSAARGTDRLGALGDLGERLDAQARAAYIARIRQLQADLDDADAAGDPERGARVQYELDFLTRELSAAYGLRGPRRAGHPAERARTAVTMRLRATLAKIRQVHPALGAHLHCSIATGRFCSYNPKETIAWHIMP